MGISLLITYHNEKELLTQCLESVFSQVVLPDEVLVYDDASKFPASDYMVYKQGLNVRLIRGNQNLMLAGARNELMRHASQEYVHYQDADDLLDVECFKVLKGMIEESPDLIINEVRSVSFETGEPISSRVIGIRQFQSKDELLNFSILGALLAPSTTFRKDFGERLGGYKSGKLMQCEDFEFNVRLVNYANVIRFVEKPIVVQRIRKGSMSHNKPELYREAIKALVLLGEELDPKYRETIGVRINRLGRQLYKIGDKREARNAFDKSRVYSKRPMVLENQQYNVIAKLFGQLTAERLSAIFQRIKGSY